MLSLDRLGQEGWEQVRSSSTLRRALSKLGSGKSAHCQSQE
jgi:hypothetical protein